MCVYICVVLHAWMHVHVFAYVYIHIYIWTCQILRMHALLFTFLVCVGEPSANGAVHSLLSTVRPQAVPDRKLGGLGSKLHLVREENAAFVSCSVCLACVQ